MNTKLANNALILVDLQNDFCAGGALAVPEGDAVIDVANRAIALFQQYKAPIIASLDWHPHTHGSFASNANAEIGAVGELNGLPQVWWPDHCIQYTHGAAFHPALNFRHIDQVILKGMAVETDSYSAFFDNGKRHTTALDGLLKKQQIKQLWVLGLATDYCVKFTVLDALELGYDVCVIADGCRGVNLQPSDSENALQEMAQKGAKIVTLQQAVADLR